MSDSQGSTTPPLDPALQAPGAGENILAPAFQVGLGYGTLGLFTGAVGGIVTSKHPILFSLVTGGQWFVLSSTYYASRRTIIQGWGGDDAIVAADRTKASGLAGALAGSVGGALRGTRSIIPGAVVFGLLGATGQALSHSYQASQEKNASNPRTSMFDSKWSPLQRLSDEQYEALLQEKLLKIDVELALIDEKVTELTAASQPGRGKQSVDQGKK